MESSLVYWKDVYQKFKSNSVCIDIERACFNGPIAVIGCYEPRDGLAECMHFIRGHNLTPKNLLNTFQKYKLVITYNGIGYDVPAIKREFGNVFPTDVKVLDLYLLAKQLGINTNLKVLENSLSVERSSAGSLKKV